jgi:putative CRISPR-associated protein (TIGR02620 family)
MMPEIVVVTRHAGLVSYLENEGFIPRFSRVMAHATPEDIRGRHVIGVLPLHLAAEAASVTEVPLSLPAELRGVELSEAQVRKFAGAPRTYRVEVVG